MRCFSTAFDTTDNFQGEKSDIFGPVSVPERRILSSLRCGALADEAFDCGGKWLAKFFEQTAAGNFGKVQLFRCGVNESASGLESVTEQSLAQRHRVKRER